MKHDSFLTSNHTVVWCSLAFDICQHSISNPNSLLEALWLEKKAEEFPQTLTRFTFLGNLWLAWTCTLFWSKVLTSCNWMGKMCPGIDENVGIEAIKELLVLDVAGTRESGFPAGFSISCHDWSPREHRSSSEKVLSDGKNICSVRSTKLCDQHAHHSGHLPGPNKQKYWLLVWRTVPTLNDIQSQIGFRLKILVSEELVACFLFNFGEKKECSAHLGWKHKTKQNKRKLTWRKFFFKTWETANPYWKKLIST